MNNPNDLISRAAATRAAVISVRDYLGNIDSERDIHIEEGLGELPAVDAVPVVHGMWIDENPDDFLDPRMRCSICRVIASPLIKWHYCPNCGAKMEG